MFFHPVCWGLACLGRWWLRATALANLCICGTGCCLASAAGRLWRWLFPGRLWPASSHRLWPGNQLWSWAAGFWGQWYSFWSCWAWRWVTLPYWCINDWLALWWKQYGPANVPCTGVYMAPGSVAFNIFQPEGKPFPFCFHGFRSCLGWATLFGVLCNGLQYCWNLVWVDMDSSGSLEDLKN